ncbi:MAG: hypothetical protein Q8S84_08640 [bacterium]|nr:hypothetical protein [bacterium]MDP3381497.1 hypothetical protein [bacterium]
MHITISRKFSQLVILHFIISSKSIFLDISHFDLSLITNSFFSSKAFIISSSVANLHGEYSL